MLYLHLLPYQPSISNFQAVNTEIKKKSKWRMRRAPQSALPPHRDKACAGVLRRRWHFLPFVLLLSGLRNNSDYNNNNWHSLRLPLPDIWRPDKGLQRDSSPTCGLNPLFSPVGEVLDRAAREGWKETCRLQTVLSLSLLGAFSLALWFYTSCFFKGHC